VTYLLIASLLALVAASAGFAYWRGEAHKQRTRADEAERRADTSDLLAADESRAKVRSVQRALAEVARLRRTIEHACNDPASAHSVLLGVLSSSDGDTPIGLPGSNPPSPGRSTPGGAG
jgi:Flp pilus assembly protein TadB